MSNYPADADRVDVAPADATPVGDDVDSTDDTVKSTDDTVKFKPIGLGKPLTIMIESVYSGPHAHGASLLVMSAVKDPIFDAPGVVAMHWWLEQIGDREFVPRDPGKQGSKVVYHTPALSELALDVAIKLKFDSFDKALYKRWVKVGQQVASLPAFLGGAALAGGVGAAGAQALVAAGAGAANLVVEVLDRQIDGGDPVNMSWDLAIADPGKFPAQAGWILITPDDFKVTIATPGQEREPTFLERIGWHAIDENVTSEYLEIEGNDYVVDDGVLRHRTDGTWKGSGEAFHEGDKVRGPFPYALLKIDGTPRRELKKWKATAVTADLAARFLNRDANTIPDAAVEAFQAWGDLALLRKAGELTEGLDATGITKKDKETLQKQIDALVDSVQDSTLKKLAQDKATEESK